MQQLNVVVCSHHYTYTPEEYYYPIVYVNVCLAVITPQISGAGALDTQLYY